MTYFDILLWNINLDAIFPHFAPKFSFDFGALFLHGVKRIFHSHNVSESQSQAHIKHTHMMVHTVKVQLTFITEL